MINDPDAFKRRMELIRSKTVRDIPLLPSEKRWLVDAIDRGIAGERDPFRVAPGGRPPAAKSHFAMAHAVHLLHTWDQHTSAERVAVAETLNCLMLAHPSTSLTLDAAYLRVGEKFCRSGDRGGVPEKAYRKNKPVLLALDVVYRARNAGRPMTGLEIGTLMEGLESLSVPG